MHEQNKYAKVSTILILQTANVEMNSSKGSKPSETTKDMMRRGKKKNLRREFQKNYTTKKTPNPQPLEFFF